MLGRGDWKAYKGKSDDELAAIYEQKADELFEVSRMEHRLATFEHLTLASMQAQSDQNFSFLVVSSDRMPIEYRRRLEKMCEGRKQIVLRFVAPMHISEAIRQYAAEVEIDLADIVQFRLMMTIASRETTSAAFGAMQLECGETPISLSVFPLFFIASPMVRPGASITGIVRSLARERQFATVAEQSLISAITKYRNTSLPLQTHIFRALSPMPVTTIRPGMRRRSCANAACLLLTSAQ